MWQAKHFQTKETIEGPEQFILDLDQRLWIDKQEMIPRSHNVPIIAYPVQETEQEIIILDKPPVIGNLSQMVVPVPCLILDRFTGNLASRYMAYGDTYPSM